MQTHATGPVTDYTVPIVQTPDVSFNPASQTICSLQPTLIQMLSSVPLTTFAWTVTAKQPEPDGTDSGAGNMITQTITNSGNTIETLTYHVTPTAWGCPPGNTMNVVVTVNPKPAVTNPVLTSQVCSAGITGIAAAVKRCRINLYLDLIREFGQCNRLQQRGRAGYHPVIDQYRI